MYTAGVNFNLSVLEVLIKVPHPYSEHMHKSIVMSSMLLRAIDTIKTWRNDEIQMPLKSLLISLIGYT